MTQTPPQQKSSPTLFDTLGSVLVEKAIREFYSRATQDAMIGYFFFDRDIDHLMEQQIVFATALLGGPKNYRGKPLRAAHSPLSVRPAHFSRRQVIMREVLADLGLTAEQSQQWLALEESFKSAIVITQGCR